ncbi:MAG: hypothetical protein GXO80_02725 [Chlorobi bacterium]|nr:hypothetical protein [Chlorobiota bacterium]
MGKLILEKILEKNSLKINLTDQSTGISLIKFYFENNIYTYKIIKQ